VRRTSVTPTGREVTFGEDEIIVSKTDLAGVITYANDVFLRVAGYEESEVLGKPHNMIRHPDMPRCVFRLLWESLERGEEIFAYVMNMAKNGDHYWVFAHVTPSVDATGRTVGYHSNRRVPYPDALPKVQALYRDLRAVERAAADAPSAIAASTRMLGERLATLGIDYDRFVFSLSEKTVLECVA
jgi:PAS domain S-box-containing protein